jgi:uncharacterized protein
VSGQPVLEGEMAPGRQRRCIATRAPRAADGMVRFVVGPDATLIPDVAGRLPGRGMWVSAEREAVARAASRNLFAKAARARVVVGQDLAAQVEAMLLRRCLDLVGLARRAGELVAGYDQVVDWLRRGRAALVLCAADGAVDGRRKVAALARDVPVVEAFARAELGPAIGRLEAVHVALAPGGVQRRLLSELRRLKGFRDFALPAELAAPAVNGEDSTRP